MKSDFPSSTRTSSRGRRLRRLVNRIHYWAAVIGSLPILFLCLTGLILVFEKELQRFEEGENTRVEPSGERLPLEALMSQVASQAGATPVYLALPEDETDVALVGTENQIYHFVNPYDGVVIESTERPAVVMRVIRILHTSFFMGEFGTWIGVVSSFFFIGLCITGCFLYLKRKLSLRTAFRVRWNPESRRHYDLHAVLGFVTAIPLLLISLSGALIGLGAGWRETILFLTDSEWRHHPKLEQPMERSDWNFNYEAVMATVDDAAPDDMFIESIVLPQNPEDPIRFRLLYPWATRPASWAFIDPGNGDLIEFHHHWEYSTGHLIHRLNRGFHSGELYTEAMRWLWFILMVVPFLLAYTGYRQWRSKRPPTGKARADRV